MTLLAGVARELWGGAQGMESNGGSFLSARPAGGKALQ